MKELIKYFKNYKKESGADSVIQALQNQVNELNQQLQQLKTKPQEPEPSQPSQPSQPNQIEKSENILARKVEDEPVEIFFKKEPSEIIEEINEKVVHSIKTNKIPERVTPIELFVYTSKRQGLSNQQIVDDIKNGILDDIAE